MKTFKIVDASIAVRWFADTDEGKQEALAVLEEIRSQPRNFFVPELFFNETLSVFCRLLKNEKEVIRNMSLLKNLGLTRIGNGHELLITAASISIDYQITGYDAVYAATAKLVNGVWLTADEKAHKKLAGLKISHLI